MNTRTKRQTFAYWFLTLATFFMYIVLTSSKNLYTAEKLTMQAVDNFNPVALASTMEYYFYSYALVQLLLVFLLKKLNIKIYLAITITISGALTILMAFTHVVVEQWIIFIINGAMQAGIWGCSLHVLSTYLPKDILPKANAIMSSGPASAFFISFGVSAIFGENWRFPFILLGIILIISVVIFFIAVSNMRKFPREVELHHVVHADGTEEDVTDEDKNDFIHLKNKKRKTAFFAFSLFLGLLVTFLYFSLNNTVDYFITNIGGFNNTISKTISMVILVLTVFGPILVVRLCEKFTNFLKVGLAFFSLSLLVSVILLVLFYLKIRVVSISLILYALYLIIVNGGRTISLSIAALRMRDKINTGIYSTMVNVLASVSAGLAPKIYTQIIDPTATNSAVIHQNWINVFSVSVILGTIVVITLITLLIWIKRLNKKDAITDAVISDTLLN